MYDRPYLLEVGQAGMIQFVIPLVSSWLPIWEEYLVYAFCLGFIAFVGCFVHSLLRR